MKISAIVLLLSLLMVCDSSGAEGSKGILYRVDGGKNPMVLLGSMHIGSEGIYPFGETIQQAAEQADCFVFECDTSNPVAYLQIQQASRWGAGDSLRAHVSEDTMTLLERLALSQSYNIQMMCGFRPWAIINMLLPKTVEVLLGSVDGSELVQNGVDSKISELVQGRQKRYLETAQEQLAALNGLSDALQEEMLRETLLLLLEEEAAEGTDADMKNWGCWWREGNAEAFAESYGHAQGAEATDEYKALMLTERNKRMTERLIALLEGEESHSYFVTVGLMHLVTPDDSVVASLTEAGYTLTQIR